MVRAASVRAQRERAPARRVRRDSMDERYRVQALDRAIDLLMAFSPTEPALGLPELARRTKLSKPTTFRLVTNLRRRGLLRQEQEGRYELGPEILALAASCRIDLRELARPIMRKLRDTVNETVVLSVRVGDERIHVEVVESRHPVRRTSYVGERVPLHAGAGSKVLLAGLEDDELERLLARARFVRYGPATILEPKRLRREVADIRERGFAESDDERALGGAGVGVPVRDGNGTVVAALHTTAPKARYTSELRDRCLRAALKAAADLSRALGHRADALAVKAGR